MGIGARTITVAAGQIDARLMNEADLTLESIDRAIDAAGRQKVDLLVLPECAYPAYLLGSVVSYRGGSHLSAGRFLNRLKARAAAYRMHIVCGFVEDTGGTLYNSAVLIDDKGRTLGVARKRFLWNADRDWFSPGDELRAFDSDLGRIGVTICAETRVPEILATLVADGAQLIAMPTCWINASRDPGRYQNPQVSFMIEARAREFGVPFVCSDKSGFEMPGTGYVGMSRVVGSNGVLLAEAPPTGDALITAPLAIGLTKPLIIDETLRLRLLSEAPAIRPASEPGRRIKLAAFPSRSAEQLAGTSEGAAILRLLAGRGVEAVVTCARTSAAAEKFMEANRRADIRAYCGPVGEGRIDLGPVKAVCVNGDAVRSFAASRVAALEGAELLVVADAPDDLALLRTRAVENRVFIAAVGERTADIIGPGGELIDRVDSGGAGEAVAEIDPAEAGDKLVAPRTDIFAERRVNLYRF